MKIKLRQITFSIEEVAKMSHFPGGEKKLFVWLRKYGYLLLNNYPSQPQIDREWFVLAKKNCDAEHKHIGILTPRVTSKGLAGLERIFKRAFPVCKPCGQKTKKF
jgi:phage antirepressor YoqD-like protein